MDRSRIYWCIAQVLALASMYPLFFAWVPWIAADPIEEVPSNVAAMMPDGCPAVFSSHAQYSCFWPGLIRDHPVQFASITGALLLVWAVLVVSALTGRGFQFRWRARGEDKAVRR
jgi:hypothetical protein